MQLFEGAGLPDAVEGFVSGFPPGTVCNHRFCLIYLLFKERKFQMAFVFSVYLY